MIKFIGKVLMLLVALAAVVTVAASTRNTGDPAPTQTDPGTIETTAARQPSAPAEAKGGIVEAILEAKWLDETALSTCVYDPELLERKTVRGLGKHASGFDLANLCDELRMNPVAAFWLLVEEGLYQKTEDASGPLGTPAFAAPGAEQKTYPNTAEGARDLLTDLLKAAGEAEDGLGLEKMALGSDGKVNADQIFERPGVCRYAYFVCYGDRTAHFLCVYFRGGETITDLEFQLLNLRYASGEPEDLRDLDAHGDRQAAALMAAAELLMTGASRADQGSIPFEYTLNEHTANLERFTFTGEAETGSLVNYRLMK